MPSIKCVLDLESIHAPSDVCKTFAECFPKKAASKKRVKGLHHMVTNVFCVGVKIIGDPDSLNVLSGDTEEDVLQQTYDYLNRYKPSLFVTFNGAEFDFDLLRLNAAVYGIPLGKLLPEGARDPRSFDIMQKLRYSTQLTTLSELRHKYFGGAKEVEGDKIQKLYEAGMGDVIIRHCEDDILTTERFYLEVVPLLWR